MNDFIFWLLLHPPYTLHLRTRPKNYLRPILKTRFYLAVNYASTGGSVKSNELGMRAMQERAYDKRGEQYLLLK